MDTRTGIGLRADAIVVAAGSSTRMGGVDKLAVELAGRPLLAWSIDALAAAPVLGRIVVVTARERVASVEAAPWLPRKVVAVVAGGLRRQDSVAAGFAALDRLAPADDRSVVLVHDGARPLVSTGLVERVAQAAWTHGAAIPVLPIAETVKRLDDDLVETTVARDKLATAQTPQGVRRGVLRAALDGRPADDLATWTDEAALLEACRIPVHAVAGEAGNFKVTFVEDLARAESALGGGNRVGFGSDSHPFGPGEPLVLGGVAFPGAPRLHGHSDGDVVLHAVADALLGAAGLGDLGRMHPAGPETPAGIDSRVLLASVLERVAAAGLRPVGLDVTIVGARPRLGARLDEIRAELARLLSIAPARVSVKGSTANLDGMEGAGRGMSAQAIATLVERR